MLQPNDLLVLLLLVDHRRGLFVSQILRASGGVIKRGTIYPLVDQMIIKGLLTEELVAPEPGSELNMPRRRIAVSSKGALELNSYLAFLNLQRKGPPAITPSSAGGSRRPVGDEAAPAMLPSAGPALA